ncbi:MAG: glycosyltransferase, partial [Candidatus Hodarchaeota archaeon]
MNILIISPQIYPCITGGVEIHNYYLTRELAKRGHKVWVLTSCGYDWNNSNISVVRLDERILLNPMLSTMFHIFLELIKLKKQVDVIYVPYTSNSHLAYPLVLAKKFFDIHYVVYIQGGGMYPWKPKTLHSLFFKYADAVVAVSEILRKE